MEPTDQLCLNILISRSLSKFRKEKGRSSSLVGHLLDVQKVAGSSPVRPTKTDKNLLGIHESVQCEGKRMPSEIFDAEKFVEISGRAEYCLVKRLKDTVKLKVRTPRKLYTLKVEPAKAEEVIKKLQCEIREI